MITVAEALNLEKAVFTVTEQADIDRVMKKVDEILNEEFDGLGAYLTVPADQATSRVMVEVTRRLMKEGWHVSLNFNVAEGRSSITHGTFKTFISYMLIIAVDPVAENVLRVRQEMAAGQ